MIKFKCERCGGKIECPDEQAGKKITCPNCRHTPLAPRPKVREPSNFGKILGIGIVVILVVGLLGYAVFFTDDSPEKEEKKETPREKSARIRRERAAEMPPDLPFEEYDDGTRQRRSEEIAEDAIAKRLAAEERERKEAARAKADSDRARKYKNRRKPKNIVID